MPRIPKIHPAREILCVLEKPWLTTKDLQIISGTGEAKAREIKKDITQIVHDEGRRLPSGLIPVDKAIEYLHLNINYLKKMAKINE